MVETLNERERNFCSLRVSNPTFSNKQCCELAGYSKNNASRVANYLLKKKKIQEHISKLRDEREKEQKVSAEYIVNNLKDIAEKCINDQKYPTAVRALETLAKIIGLFVSPADESAFKDIQIHIIDDESIRKSRQISNIESTYKQDDYTTGN